MRCPQCGRKLPEIRMPNSIRQAMWGEVTCSCGCELDRFGRPLCPVLSQASPRTNLLADPDDLQADEPNKVLLWLVLAVPGLIMGCMYSLPAMKITHCREPWYTLLLALGLLLTVNLLGLLFNLSAPWLAGVCIGSQLLLLIRRAFGKLDRNVERFGFVHVFAMFGVYWAYFLENWPS